MRFLEWLGQSSLGVWVSESGYGYYLLLAGHAIGMAIVVGTAFMLCARVLGFRKSVPIDIFDRLFQLAWIGFALNALTGVGLFAANGKNLVQNAPFLWKLTFIALGGIALWFLARTLETDQPQLAATGEASGRAKVIATLTLACWTAAIIAGRIIAYTIKYY
jgi:hypothetical protein